MTKVKSLVDGIGNEALTEKYYDDWGARVYTYVSDPKIIKINFLQAKLLGAEYVISKHLISNHSH